MLMASQTDRRSFRVLDGFLLTFLVRGTNNRAWKLLIPKNTLQVGDLKKEMNILKCIFAIRC